jgi:hypothetical protein
VKIGERDEILDESDNNVGNKGEELREE